MKKINKICNGANKPLAESLKKERTVILSRILKDFIKSKRSINGYGIFEGITPAKTFAERITKNQLRRLIRYGIVPAAFIEFLGIMGINIQRNQYVRQEMTEGHLSMILMTGRYDCKSEEEQSDARSAAEYLGKMILLTTFPELSKSFRLTVNYRELVER